MPRNASGSYTLPAGNPVVSGTTIASTWANTTLDDLKSEMTDSLSRSGKGGMLGQLQLTDGTAAAPGLAFSSELTTGLYRPAANELGLTRAGTAQLRLTSGASAPAWTLSSPQSAGGTQTDFFFHVTTTATGRALFGIRNGPSDRFVVTTANLQTTNNIQFTAGGGVGDTISQIGTNAGLIFKGNRSAADTDDDIVVNSTATRTDGNLLNVKNNNSSQWRVAFDGNVTQTGALTSSAAVFNIGTSGSNGRVNITGNKAASDAGTDVTIGSGVTRTAGLLLDVDNNSSTRWNVDFSGNTVQVGNASISQTLFATVTNGPLILRGKRNAADVNADVIVTGQVTRTAGNLLEVSNNLTPKLVVDFNGALTATSTITPGASSTGTLTPGTNWVDGGGSYCKKTSGMASLHINYVVTAGGSFANTIATVPVGFRPLVNLLVIGEVTDTSAGTVFAAEFTVVSATGAITINRYDNGTSLVNLFAAGTNDNVIFQMAYPAVA